MTVEKKGEQGDTKETAEEEQDMQDSHRGGYSVHGNGGRQREKGENRVSDKSGSYTMPSKNNIK